MNKPGCESCGHPQEYVNSKPVQGHNYGCPESLAVQQAQAPAEPVGLEPLCEFGNCQNFKRPQGKGPKPKYCEEHSDPKKRK